MQKKNFAFAAVLVSFLFIFLFFNTVSVSAATVTLKEGMRGSAVSELQKNLKTLGFFSATPTGYYGEATEAAVKKFQARYSLKQDGIAGSSTLNMVSKLLGKPQTAAVAKTAAASTAKTAKDYLVPWFGNAEKIFARGKTATVYDIGTGLSFKVKRTYGTNHADCEALTAADSAVIKKIYGGTWSWDRRAVIVTVDGRKMAASMAGMPHAGVESVAANVTVSSRSGGYGRGTNLDTVKNNGMSGHFDIHFLGSKTHGTNKVDEKHQEMIQKAAEWAKKNY